MFFLCAHSWGPHSNMWCRKGMTIALSKPNARDLKLGPDLRFNWEGREKESRDSGDCRKGHDLTQPPHEAASSPDRQQPALQGPGTSQTRKSSRAEPEWDKGNRRDTILQVFCAVNWYHRDHTISLTFPFALQEVIHFSLKIPTSYLSSNLNGCHAILTDVWPLLSTEGGAVYYLHVAGDPVGHNGAVGACSPIHLCALRISASELFSFGGLMHFLLPFHIASGDVLHTDSYS